MKRALSAATLAVLAAGCSQAPVRDPDFAAVRPPAVPEPPASGGALYREGFGLTLFEDLRARRVGDLLTVTLDERTDAEKTAETETTKETSARIANPTLLGSPVEFDTPGILPLASRRDNSLETSVSAEHEFEGETESTQSNRLRGSIAVTVAEVLPNGDLVVQGEKLITLTDGHEHVRLSGIVRQADIAPDNTVSSTKVGNARIEYAGQGAGADANVMGWLARFFVSAFFPF